ncbi:MAG: DUF1624 domain-containing protein [Bacteroidales bacterium]|nr:DUF1624 domain-containing protein [Bacteroidales bacterium]
MTERSRTSDFIKGVAIFAMVQVILLEAFAKQYIADGITGKISMFLGGAPAAPVFLTVMGYYIAHNKHNFRYYVDRGFRLILIGILLNIGESITLWLQPGHSLVLPDFFHFLLGVDILIMAGISLIIMAALISLFRGIVPVYLFLIFVVLLIPYVLPHVAQTHPDSLLLPFLYGKYPNSYFPILPWFAYVLAGYSFFQFKRYFISDEFKHNQTVKIILLIASGVVLLTTAPFGFNVSIKRILFSHHGVLFFLFCVNFVFWWLLSARAIVYLFNNRITRYVEWLGKNVTAFYVFFMLLVGNLSLFFHKTQGYFELILWFVAFITISSLLVLGWRRLNSPRKIL